MDPKAENKQTIMYQKGKTEDIISSVISVFEESKEQIQELSQSFKADTVRETCNNIAEYVINNFKYRVDPDGEQWIRTPARLLKDREADCKSFSLFVCAALSNLGIKNGFRFVSYTGDKQYTHVYTVAIDEKGKKITVDTVARIQKGVSVFEELKYKHKKDIMNTTKISKLSGVEVGEVQEERVIKASDSVAAVYAKTLYFKAKVLGDDRLCTALQVLINLLQTYKDERDLNLALYKWADLYINVEDTSANTQNTIIKAFVENVGKENSKYLLDGSVLDDPQYKQIEAWLNEYILPYAFDYIPTEPQTAIKELYLNTFNFIYLFVDNRYLTKTQIAKKENQDILLQTIIANTSLNRAAALNLIFCFCTMQFGMTPHNVAAYLFKSIPAEEANIRIGEIVTDNDNFMSDLNSSLNEEELNYYKSGGGQSKQNVITNWINTAVNAFSKVWQTVTGSSRTNYYNNGVTPAISDGSTDTGIFNYLLIGALVVGGVMIIKNKKKDKK